MLFIVFCFIFAVDDNIATFNWSRCREQEASECSAKKRDICTTLPSPKDQESVQRRTQKSVRTRRDGWLQETCLPSQQGRCTSALSVTVKACMRPVQAQVRPHPSMKQESWGETSPLPKKLLATESHWGRESQFPLRVQPVMYQWRPRVQEPMGSINCTWRVETKQQKKPIKLGDRHRPGVAVDLGGLCRGHKYDQKTIYEIFKTLTKMRESF